MSLIQLGGGDEGGRHPALEMLVETYGKCSFWIASPLMVEIPTKPIVGSRSKYLIEQIHISRHFCYFRHIRDFKIVVIVTESWCQWCTNMKLVLRRYGDNIGFQFLLLITRSAIILLHFPLCSPYLLL